MNSEQDNNISKPRPQKKENRIGSKTAPIETDTDFHFDVDNNEDYISTYNYYIYYNSIKPRDPRLPKPTYTPMPNMKFIKEGTSKENDIKENEEDYGELGGNFHQFLNEEDKLDKMMNNLNLKDNNVKGIPEVNEDYEKRDFDNNQNPVFGNVNNGNNEQMAPNPVAYFYGGMNNDNNNNQNNYDNMMINNPFDYGMINNNNEQMNNFYNQNLNSGNDVDNKQNQNNFYNMRNNNNSNSNNNMYPNMNNNIFINQNNNNNNNNGNPFVNMSEAYPNFKNMYNSYMMNMGYPINMNGLPMNSMNIQNMQMFNVYMNKYNQNYNQKQKKQNYPNNYMNMNFINNNNFIKKPNQINETATTFEEVYNSIPEICKSHTGSRIFQKIYEEGNEEQKQQIIEKIKPEVYLLSKDVFGNYVIQRLLESVSIENKKVLISQLFGKIKELTLHMYGCRVIQKAIDVADTNDVRRHLIELQNDLIKCIQDQNGNHVIQKLIEKLPKGEHGPIVNSIKGKVYQLSIHQYGCRVIQRIFEYCTDEEKDIVLKETYERINELCLDQYGNYVIQNIIEKIKDNQKIYDGIQGKIFQYSLHKFASNVVEKCLTLGNKSQNEKIVNEIIEQDNKSNNILLSLVKDKFGNYVVQKMIEFSDMKNKVILVKKIISSQVLKKRDGFSKHVMGMIEKLGLTSLLEQGNNDNQNINNNTNFNKGSNL